MEWNAVAEEIMKPLENLFDKVVLLQAKAFSKATLVELENLTREEEENIASIGLGKADREFLAERIQEISIEMDAALSSVRRDIESLLDSDVNQGSERGDYEIIVPDRKKEFITCDGDEVRRELFPGDENTI